MGIHIVLHPYGVELGSWNGEDPEYLAKMSAIEVESIQVEDGTFACTKHFIARGGDSSFSNARSVAQTVDNWMVPWQAAIDAGTKWVMTNGYSTGLSNTVHVDYDVETLTYLRETLGFDGVILSDWGDQGDNNSSGVTADGIDLDTLTIPERYAFAFNAGMDQFGSPAADFNVENPGYTGDLSAMTTAVEEGLVTMERLDESVRRILRTKFELGLFENPYSDAEEALALCASDAYVEEPWEITDLDTLTAARNQDVVELERQLMAESTVLVKNTDGLLPLSADLKVYIGSTAAAATLEAYKEAIGAYATVVEDVEDADVVIADCTQFNDTASVLMDDADYYGKKLVVVANCVDPDTYAMENADAVLFMNFTRGADHGTGAGGFITTMEPSVYAEILYGVREPEGMIVKEIARDTIMDNSQWKDLAGDQGASDWVRLMLLATMKENPAVAVPNNWGDPLLCYEYGMRYGQSPDFEYDTLVLPTVVVETTNENGRTSTSSVPTTATVGEPYTVNFLLWNHGEDGVETVRAMEGETVVAEKLMAVNGGSWRVVSLDLVFEAAGEHTITIGGLSATITVE